MEISESVRAAYEEFCRRLSASDVAGFDELVAPDAALIVGTAPEEWIEDRAAMRFGFETEGVTLLPAAPDAYEEGTMGWVADRPTFGFPDGSTLSIRLTTVFRRDEDRWKVVHGHFSVGVPDDEVVELTRRWST